MKIQKSYHDDNPKLYIIPTPIGNLEDITIRSLKQLEELDYLFCEDTRVTKKLLNHYEITLKLEVYQEHNEEKASHKIISLLNQGNKVGVVSDAGMPGVSDPGYLIVQKAVEENINVIILPGASAFVVGLVRSTFNTEKFTFYGFLNKNNSKRKHELEIIIKGQYPTVIYESPYKIISTLQLIDQINHKVDLLVAKEISKIYEQYIEGKANELIDYFSQEKVRGEFLIVIRPEMRIVSINDPKFEVNKLIDLGMDKKDAIKKVAKLCNRSKNDIYQLMIGEEDV